MRFYRPKHRVLTRNQRLMVENLISQGKTPKEIVKEHPEFPPQSVGGLATALSRGGKFPWQHPKPSLPSSSAPSIQPEAAVEVPALSRPTQPIPGFRCQLDVKSIQGLQNQRWIHALHSCQLPLDSTGREYDRVRIISAITTEFVRRTHYCW